MSTNIFGCHQWGWRYWHAAEHPAMHRTAPHSKEYCPWVPGSPTVEKP